VEDAIIVVPSTRTAHRCSYLVQWRPRTARPPIPPWPISPPSDAIPSSGINQAEHRVAASVRMWAVRSCQPRRTLQRAWAVACSVAAAAAMPRRVRSAAAGADGRNRGGETAERVCRLRHAPQGRTRRIHRCPPCATGCLHVGRAHRAGWTGEAGAAVDRERLCQRREHNLVRGAEVVTI
jgi:hypothetical protein